MDQQLNVAYFLQMTSETSDFDVAYSNVHSELITLLTNDHFKTVIYNLNETGIQHNNLAPNQCKYVLFPHVDKFKFNMIEERAIELVKTYNNMNTLSLVAYNSVWNQSTPDKFLNQIILILDELVNVCSTINFGKKCIKYNMLAVIEYAPVKGWHTHILIFDNYNIDHRQEVKLEFLNKIIIHINNFIKQHECLRSKILMNAELAKSVASIVNYLKKDPKFVFSNNTDTYSMYQHFDRTYIFSKDSVPKYQLKFDKTNTIVKFFTNLIEDGCSNYQQALRDPRSIQYLHYTNLERIWFNCYTHFIATRTTSSILIDLIRKFHNLKSYQKCICPVVDYLKYQNVNLWEFEKNIGEWLLANSKKNTLLFEGPSNTGKSFFARLILECFRFTNSLCNDNLFTFANIIDQDVLLWDEPMIHPDVADLAKTVLEGGPNLVIPIKHKLPGNTKRKVPIIICSNHEITNYCSSEYENMSNRCRLFNFNNNILNATFCKSTIHNCQHLSEYLLTDNTIC